jgi:hypothetical protein
MDHSVSTVTVNDAPLTAAGAAIEGSPVIPSLRRARADGRLRRSPQPRPAMIAMRRPATSRRRDAPRTILQRSKKRPHGAYYGSPKALPVFRYSAAPSTIDVRASSSNLGGYHESHRRPPRKQFVALVVVCGAKSSARIPSRAERGIAFLPLPAVSFLTRSQKA